MEEITKICTKCGVDKPLDEYWNHPNGKYGKRPRCKACVREENAEFEKTYRPKRQDKSQAWYESNKDAVKDGREKSGWRWKYKPENKRNHNLKARYGISAKPVIVKKGLKANFSKEAVQRCAIFSKRELF